MNASDFIGREVFIETFKVGKVEDLIFDEKWKITHLEIDLEKDAAEEILGAKASARNTLAISAMGPEAICCDSRNRVDLKVSKGQLHIYLRPV